MKYARYTDEHDKPFAACPKCGRDWTAPEGVRAVITNGVDYGLQPCRLGADGSLEYPLPADADGAFVSTVYCPGCRKELRKLKGVHEELLW